MHIRLTPDEAQAQQTFRAMLAALSYPGRPQDLPAHGGEALDMIGATLLDLETSFYCPEAELAARLSRSGAPAAPPAAARYHFYPTLAEADLAAIAEAAIGSYRFPDDSATLILGCRLGAGPQLQLRGPGISGSAALRLAGPPPAFWELRTRAIRYPLGWDIFLVDDDQVVGLPRTTTVEVR
jgi:alpha-D-ribose 1-methylphosphonate 5-triphosphate synthase subunit PhnH